MDLGEVPVFETANLEFCTVEFHEGFMTATLHSDSSIGYDDTVVLSRAKKAYYGLAPVGLVINNPASSHIDADVFSRADTLMKEQGYSFLIVARPSPSGTKLLDLFNKLCLIYIAGSLEEAIVHAEELVKKAACN